MFGSKVRSAGSAWPDLSWAAAVSSEPFGMTSVHGSSQGSVMGVFPVPQYLAGTASREDGLREWIAGLPGIVRSRVLPLAASSSASVSFCSRSAVAREPTRSGAKCTGCQRGSWCPRRGTSRVATGTSLSLAPHLREPEPGQTPAGAMMPVLAALRGDGRGACRAPRRPPAPPRHELARSARHPASPGRMDDLHGRRARGWGSSVRNGSVRVHPRVPAK